MGNIRYKGGNYTRDARSSYVVVEPLSVTENGTYTAESGKAYNPVTVNIAPAESNDVNFYDYDGTIVYSYTKEQFSELTEMPANPTHSGLTSQGWNWSLSDAKQYVTDYGKLNIGQMYITDDGKTRLVIRLKDGKLSPTFGIGVNGTVTVDWGDGSEFSTLVGTSLNNTQRVVHEYAISGEYTILVSVNGSAEFRGSSSSGAHILSSSPNSSSDVNSVYAASIYNIFIGENISIGNYAFDQCVNLMTIILPSGISTIGQNAFGACYSTKCLVLPNNLSYIGTFGLTPRSGRIVFSNSLTYIPTNCCNGSGVEVVTISNQVTSIGDSSFYSCWLFREIIIPDSVTSIGSNSFYRCRALSSIVLPKNLLTIGDGAFSECYGLGFIRFKSQEPPTVGSGAFRYVPISCIIYVPTGTIETYKATANMPNPSTYTYVEYT